MHGAVCCENGKSLMEMTASRLNGRVAPVFEGGVSCHELAEAIVRGGYGGIPIVNRECVLIGIVTEYDLLNAILTGKAMAETRATEVMTEPSISITEEMTIEEVIALFQSRHLIRVPVVSSGGRVIGIVERKDILACYVESTLGSPPSSDTVRNG